MAESRVNWQQVILWSIPILLGAGALQFQVKAQGEKIDEQGKLLDERGKEVNASRQDIALIQKDVSELKSDVSRVSDSVEDIQQIQQHQAIQMSETKLLLNSILDEVKAIGERRR